MSKVVRMSGNMPKKQTFKVSDMFKDTRTEEQKRVAKLQDELNKAKGISNSKKVYMSSEQETKLENAHMLDKLFNENRYAMSVSNDNSKSKDISLNYAKGGQYFTDVDGDSVYISNISKIEKLDYIPSSAIVNRSLKYVAYNLYEKHNCGQDVLIARVVFAS